MDSVNRQITIPYLEAIGSRTITQGRNRIWPTSIFRKFAGIKIQ